MLVLTRNLGEEIIIDDDIRVVITSIKDKSIKIGIKAPNSISIFREEIYPSKEIS